MNGRVKSAEKQPIKVWVAGQAIVEGEAEGEVISTDVPLSFWGGLNPGTGEIIDRHHPLWGKNVSGRVLVLPSSRGSCTGSGVLLQAIHAGRAPAAILMKCADEIISIGAIVADEIFHMKIPVLVLNETPFNWALNATSARIARGGMVELHFERESAQFGK